MGLHGVGRGRVAAGLDSTEAAAAGAGVAEEHDGGSGNAVSAAIPALADVGALRLLADCVELQPRQRLLHLIEPLSLRRPLLQPRRLLRFKIPTCIRPYRRLLHRKRLRLHGLAAYSEAWVGGFADYGNLGFVWKCRKE